MQPVPASVFRGSKLDASCCQTMHVKIMQPVPASVFRGSKLDAASCCQTTHVKSRKFTQPVPASVFRGSKTRNNPPVSELPSGVHAKNDRSQPHQIGHLLLTYNERETKGRMTCQAVPVSFFMRLAVKQRMSNYVDPNWMRLSMSNSASLRNHYQPRCFVIANNQHPPHLHQDPI